MANETAFAFLDDIELPVTKPGSIPGKRVSGLACYVVSPGGLKTVVQAVEQAKKAAGLCVSDPVKHSMDKQIESIYRSSHIGKRAETHFDLAKASVRDVAVEALKALVDADAKIIAGVLWPWASTPAKKPQPALLRWAFEDIMQRVALHVRAPKRAYPSLIVTVDRPMSDALFQSYQRGYRAADSSS